MRSRIAFTGTLSQSYREVLLSRANELALAHPGYVSATNDSGISKFPVMAVLVTAIHVRQHHQDVDARDKPGHDGGASKARRRRIPDIALLTPSSSTASSARSFLDNFTGEHIRRPDCAKNPRS